MKKDENSISFTINIPVELEVELKEIAGSVGINNWLIRYIKKSIINHRKNKVQEDYNDLKLIRGE